MSEDRPYQLCCCPDLDQGHLSEFMEWLKSQGRANADPLGIATAPGGGIALASSDRVFLLHANDNFALGALAAALMGSTPPRLVAVDAEDALIEISRLLGDRWYNRRDLFERMAACMLGDLGAAAHCGDYGATWCNLELPDMAYTARLLEPQYQFETPRFYPAVSVPLTHLRAEWALFGGGKQPEWWVSYPDLWLRVLTHFTGDPTLSWLIQSGHAPLEGVARLFEWTPTTTEAVLVWHACGRTIDVMAERFPKLVNVLPDNLPGVGEMFNRRMPTLWLGINHIMGTYQRDRMAKTLYGRKLRGGLHPGHAAAHAIFGTVQDILETAAVTLWKNRLSPAIMICGMDHFPIRSVSRVVGTGFGEDELWQDMIKRLAPLGRPLSVTLEPVVGTPPALEAAISNVNLLESSSPGAAPPSIPEPSNATFTGSSVTTPTTRTRKKKVVGSTSTGRSAKARPLTQTRQKDFRVGPKRSHVTDARR